MEQHADELLAQVGLARVAGNRYETLSSGERVRSLIARALTSRPKLLLLDEPTAGLDLLAREQILATVQSLFDRAGQAAPTVVMMHHPPGFHQRLILCSTTAPSPRRRRKVKSEILSRVYRCRWRSYSHGRWSIHVHPSAWEGLLGGKFPL
jgi:iron complex transport system ATP-binding protein